MAESRGDGGRDWRRKLSSSTPSAKPSSKDGSKPKNIKDKPNSATASAASPLSERPPQSPARSTPASPKGKQVVGQGRRIAGTDESVPTTPVFGNAPSGFRNNMFRSGKEKATSSRDENANDRLSPNSSRDTKGSGRPRGLDEVVKSIGRSASGNKLEKEPSSPTHEATSGDGSGDEDSGREEKRGSMIGKVAHRAKMVLPLKRTKELGRSESSRSLTSKSTPSSSSMQSSPRLTLPKQDTISSSEDEDDDEDVSERVKAGDRFRSASSANDGSRIRPQKYLTTDPAGLSPVSPTTQESSRGDSAAEHGERLPQEVIRPRTVPPRIASSDAIHQNRGLSMVKPGLARPLIGTSGTFFSDVPAQESAKDQAGKGPPLRNSRSINGLSSSRQKKPSMNSIREVSKNTSEDSPTIPPTRPSTTAQSQSQQRPSAPRSTSAIKDSVFASSTSSTSKAITKSQPVQSVVRKPPTFAPPIPDPESAPNVDTAPPTGMYWSKAQSYGYDHSALRAHTSTLIGNHIYVFGGCDSTTCFNDLYVFDADCMYWSHPPCSGDSPPPLRAMTATAVGKKIIIFGGGDGPTYYNDIYILDTATLRYTKPSIEGAKPCRRRAHTACFYKNGIYVFGGGDGEKALNDVWRLDVADTTKLSWKLISPPARQNPGRPTARGYHTANMVGSKLIIFGGSDGVECFRDVWVFDVETLAWKSVEIKVSHPRLSHTATVVGSFLFVIGGHDGVEYSSEVLLLNLVTMQWDRRKTYGVAPSGRGYHGTVLYDSRLFVTGGFDGTTVFDGSYILELAVSAYYSQISHFTIDV